MAINDPIRELFPGINAPDGTGAPGTDPGSSAIDSVSTTITSPTGASQDRYSAASSTIQPGQLQLDWMGVPTEFIASSGAGHGSGDHFPRRPGQQSAT